MSVAPQLAMVVVVLTYRSSLRSSLTIVGHMSFPPLWSPPKGKGVVFRTPLNRDSTD